MTSTVLPIAALFAACACFAETINFDNTTPGALPPGWPRRLQQWVSAPVANRWLSYRRHLPYRLV
jgi:hypothetical protein